MRGPVVEVLGPVRLTSDGREVRLGGPRERAVLALLAAAGDRRITPERLLDEVWGESPGDSALGSLQVAVSRLRSALRSAHGADAAPAGSPISLAPGGYRLEGVRVDAAEMTATVRDISAAAPRAVVAMTDAALSRWRGRPYADLPEIALLAGEAGRLEEDRVLLEEARAEALLGLGQHSRVPGLLAGVAPQHPFREPLWRLWALALYRCDRQADALEVLRRLRRSLAEELGVDPSPATRDLERAVLGQDASLVTGVAAGQAVQEAVREAVRDSPREAPGRAGTRPILVGRDDLTQRLRARLEAATQGVGGVVLLTGDAGIGKTAVVRDLVGHAQDRGVGALVGQCHEADIAPAYWPWLPVLRPLVGDDAPPDVAALLGDGVGREPVIDAGSSSLRLFESVARVLAGAGPLVVVLEDLHWSDASSLRLLAYAAEALSTAPILVVLTARDVESRQHPALTTCFAALSRLGAERVRVPPLASASLRELVRPVVDDPDRDLVDVLAERTDGNPFFALQFVRLLAAQGDASGEAARALEVPDGIADVLRLRLLRLSPGARDAVATAAVAGREFDADVVQEALGRPALDELDEAVRSGLLEDSAPAGAYRFVHALTRETVYADEPSGRRAGRHAALASVLAARLEAEPDLVAQVANHYAEASALIPDLLPASVDLQTRSAQDAERRGAYDEALVAWERAARMEGRLPPDGARRHRLLLALATARQRTGDMAGMETALGAAIDAARERGDWVGVAQAATAFRSSGVWYWRELGFEDRHTITALRESLDHVTDPNLLARVWANLGLEYYGLWRSVEANECGERSVALARRTGDHDTLLTCLTARSIIQWMPGDAPHREATAREILTLDVAPEDEISARYHLGTALRHQQRTVEADAVMDRALTLAAALRHTNCDVPLAWWRWMRAAETLDPETPRLAEAAMRLHRRTTMMSLHEVTALVVLDQLPAHAAVPPDVVRLGRGHGQYAIRAAVGCALVSRGHVEEGLAAIGPLPPGDEYDYASVWASCLHAEAFGRAGVLEPLAELVERLEPRAAEAATYGGVHSLGSIAHYLGRASAVLGRRDDAVAYLEMALADNERGGATRFVEPSRRALGQIG